MQRRGGSFHLFLDLVLLPLLSQPYSRTLPSSDRYDKRYEGEVPEEYLPASATSREVVMASRMWRCRGTGYLTNFSADSEYSSNAFSEASQSLSDGLRVVSNGSGLVKL